MKKASSRSQRGSKGIKGKHVLQICVLLGVCIWLIYQVKYSHDKKKEFFEKDGTKSTVLLSESDDGLVKLGRKDLLPGYHNNKNEKERHVEEDEDEEEISHGEEEKERLKSSSKVEEEKEEEEEEVVEEDEEDKTKQGEEVVDEDEEENKHEEDEIDEQDQSKSGGEADELLEEEKEKETETKHADEIDMTVDEAREEHYKADDASSAVSHETRVLNTEKMKESSGNSTETVQENDPNAETREVEARKEPGLKLGEVESSNSVEKTTTVVKDGDSESPNSETKSAVTESKGETVNSNLTVAMLEASGFLKNETEIMQDRSREHNKVEDGAPPAGSSDIQSVSDLEQTRNKSDPNITVSANITDLEQTRNVSDPNITISANITDLEQTRKESDPNITISANITNKDSIQDESKNSTSESSLIENISSSNKTEVKENSVSEGDEESGEKENTILYSTDQTEEADDTSETSFSQEERDALIDPQTLPDIRTEGNEEDEEEAIAAE